MATSPSEARRSSIQKAPLPSSNPFERLPDEIIEQILLATDPNGFASLVLLNTKWRAVSQRPHLYHHHLSRCPSFGVARQSIPSPDDDNLPKLRRLFAREVKRNLFDAYLRPKETVVKLVSNSISSSSCPGGEGMQFSFSPRGHRVLAYNSSRIHVLNIQGPQLVMVREFKILRRPVSVCIKDDGSLLAVLSSEMQVDLYDLQPSPPLRKQSIILDNTPRTMAISPCGSVLAAAYEGGIEVSSLNPGALPTDRRAVKCDAVDTLAFSYDGTQILGTTIHSSPPSTVIITAPYFDPGSQLDNDLTAMWTNSILFPNTSRDCSHAVLLQDGSQEEAAWTFTYDRSFETFRAVRIDDLRNGTTYFTGPIPDSTSQAKLLPCTAAAATYRGELVSAGFQGKEIWVYGIPEDLDAVLDAVPSQNDSGPGSSHLARRNSAQGSLSRHASPRAQDAGGVRLPQWQLLCDQQRNTFKSGRKIAELIGMSSLKWVEGFGKASFHERIVAGARGVSGPRLATDEEDIDFVDGGRITLLDFDYGVTDGGRAEVTIELGTGDAEVLEEERRDMETEVAIVRRRTMTQRRSSRMSVLRPATGIASHLPPVPPIPPAPVSPRPNEDDDDPLLPRRIGQNPSNHRATVSVVSDAGDAVSIEEQEVLDLPYANASPRSGPSLRRAATAAAVNRRLNPRTADGRPIEYRRADGRNEHPHESDADNWVPPPPPYQKEDPGDMPDFMRGKAAGSLGPSVPPMPPMPSVMTLESLLRNRGDNGGPSGRSGGFNDMSRGPDFAHHRPSHQRTASDSTTFSRRRTSDIPRPMSSPSIQADVENLYDVSPQESPRLAPHRPNEPEADPLHDIGPLPAASVSPPLPEDGSPQRSVPAAEVSQAQTPATEDSPLRHPILPALGLQIPPAAQLVVGQSSSAATPYAARRLSNSQTWPHDPRPATSYDVGYPYSAPAIHHAPDMMAGTLPRLPTSGQFENRYERTDQGHPHRVSGGFSVPRVPVGSRNSGVYGSLPSNATRPRQPEPEQPLIISTPTGVTGAFDPPSGHPSMAPPEHPILAPVPRYPRQSQGPVRRPTVERLENIYGSPFLPGQIPEPPPIPNDSGILPSWLRSSSIRAPSIRSTRSLSGVRRRRSRAERSAAKNVQDARRSGWTGRKKKQTQEPPQQQPLQSQRVEHGNLTPTDWTEVTAASPARHRKCVVM